MGSKWANVNRCLRVQGYFFVEYAVGHEVSQHFQKLGNKELNMLGI